MMEARGVGYDQWTIRFTYYMLIACRSSGIQTCCFKRSQLAAGEKFTVFACVIALEAIWHTVPSPELQSYSPPIPHLQQVATYRPSPYLHPTVPTYKTSPHLR